MGHGEQPQCKIPVQCDAAATQVSQMAVLTLIVMAMV